MLGRTDLRAPELRTSGLRRIFFSARVRAILALGMVLGLGAVGTMAAWSDTATATSDNFVTGTIDLRAGGVKTYNFSTLTKTSMPVGPGAAASSVSQNVTVTNVGSLALKYSMTASVPAANTLASALRVTVVPGGTPSAGACTGGTVTATNVALVAPGSTANLITNRDLVATTGTENVCISVVLPAASSATLVSTTLSSIAFNFTGVSV